jgi:hypothetical protein
VTGLDAYSCRILGGIFMADQGASKRDLGKHRDYGLLREFKATSLALDALPRWGAHSMGIGRKRVAGKATDQLSLRVYVASKRPETLLSREEKVPDHVRFLSRKAKREVRLETDVIETPPAQFEVDPETRIRPVPGGVSGGILAATGTIGGWVWDNADDTIVMLSNDHVFEHTAGIDILQQGTADGGSLPGDKIGDVKRGIARSATTPNTVDCAIGDPDSSDIYDLSVLEIGPAVYATEVAALDMLVEKYGQTTRHTFGEVQDVDWTGFVSGLPFEDCLFVDIVPPSTDWSAGGDSGSLVFAQAPIEPDSEIKPVVGLHFAGGGTHGIECKIQNVFDRLNLTTLCAGAFSAFLDALFEAETEGEVSERAEARLRTISAFAAGAPIRSLPPSFVRKERREQRSRFFYTGFARDIQERLAGSKRGRIVTDFADKHRAQLLTLLAKDRDVRRATVAALKPIVAGASTTTEVLERILTERDIKNLDLLAREVGRKSGRKLQGALKMIRSLGDKAAGKSLARILGIELRGG